MNQSYIIFICTFDPFGKGNYFYSFTNRCCQYPKLELGDDTQKIFLNTKGILDDVRAEVKEFLHYIESSTDEAAVFGTELIRNVHKRVNEVKLNKVAEVEYMTLLMRENEIYEEAFEEGREEGKEEGQKLAKRTLLLKAFNKGKSYEEIADLFDMTVDEVERIVKGYS